MDKQVKNHYDYIKNSNDNVLRFLNNFRWGNIHGLENKKHVLRMSIIHSFGEVNYNQEKLFKTRDLNWDAEVYSDLYEETFLIQSKLKNIIKHFTIEEEFIESVNDKVNEKMKASEKVNKQLRRKLCWMKISFLLNFILILIIVFIYLT